MSKRPRAQHTPPEPSALFLDNASIPVVAPLPVSLSLLVQTPLQPGVSARALLKRVVGEERAFLTSPAYQHHREQAMVKSLEASQRLEAVRWEVAGAVEAEAGKAGRKAGEAGAASCGPLAPGEELSRDALSTSADASAVALREYGFTSASHALVSAVAWGEEAGEPAAAFTGGELPPPALAVDPTRMYSGRPLRGATNAAAYLSAEREMGFPPPRRDAWRYPIQASAVSSAMDPHLVSSAREMLKRPVWPDRLYPRPSPGGGAGGAGSVAGRAIALAAHSDEGKALEDGIQRLHLRALARV